MTYLDRGNDLIAIDDLDLTVEAGTFTAVVGPSGCGKSTLLKAIGNLITPTRGVVEVDGRLAEEARRNGYFSYVFQNPVLFPWRNVRDNVRLACQVLRRQGRDADELLDLVGLGQQGDRHPTDLSGGMQQRVALARALSFDPRLLLMDEPFGALDELTREQLNLELLRVWRRLGVTVLFVTHSLAEAVFLADEVVVLCSQPASIKSRLKVPLARPRVPDMINEPGFRDVVRGLRESLE